MVDFFGRDQIISNTESTPHICTLPNGGKFASLPLPTSESWRNRESGKHQEKAEWRLVTVCAPGNVEYLGQHAKNGKSSASSVEARLETRKWQDKDGKDCDSTETTARPFLGVIELLQGNSDLTTGPRTTDPLRFILASNFPCDVCHRNRFFRTAKRGSLPYP